MCGVLQQMCSLSDRKSKPPTLNCRRATDGSITAKVGGRRVKEDDRKREETKVREEEEGSDHNEQVSWRKRWSDLEQTGRKANGRWRRRER